MVHCRIETALTRSGYDLIAGVDEAGRGPLAGPVVASAVILPNKCRIEGLDDSKKLSPKKREIIYQRIIEKAVYIGIGSVSEKTIDRINILRATLLAMKKAVMGLSKIPGFILVDGNIRIPSIGIPQTAVIRGDSICSSIAAASVISKVTRDRYMMRLDKKYPQYGFASHKGYGTKRHLDALDKYGPSPVHRLSFAPIYDIKKNKES